MRFEFCGHISCPEWFIAEISVLTKITAVKMKLVFAQLIVHYLEGSEVGAKCQKLLGGTGLDYYEMHAVVATLNFILHNSTMFQVTDPTLFKELVDLGLPKQNVESITKVFKTNRDKLIQVSLDRGIKISKDADIAYSIHQFVGSSGIEGPKGIRFAQCELTYKPINKPVQSEKFIIGETQLDDLIFQMEEAARVMRGMEGKSIL